MCCKDIAIQAKHSLLRHEASGQEIKPGIMAFQMRQCPGEGARRRIEFAAHRQNFAEQHLAHRIEIAALANIGLGFHDQAPVGILGACAVAAEERRLADMRIQMHGAEIRTAVTKRPHGQLPVVHGAIEVCADQKIVSQHVEGEVRGE